MKKCILLFIVLLAAGHLYCTASTFILDEIEKPEDIQADKSHIYITEGASVYIYSKKDLKLIKKFGKQGEGPEEFKINEKSWSVLFIDVSGKNILVHSMGKLSWFTKEGVFLKMKKFNVSPSIVRTKVFNKNFAGMFISQDKKRFRGLKIYDINQNLVKEVCKNPDVFQYGKGMDIFKYSTAFTVNQNKLFYTWGDEFIIKVIGSDGKELCEIKYPYKRVKVTAENREDILGFYKKDPTTKEFFHMLKPFKFSEYFPAVSDLLSTDNRLFVVTNRKEGENSEMLIFTHKGDFVKKIFFPLKMNNPVEPYPYIVSGNKIYQLEEDLDEEEWKLHVTDI